MEERMTTTHAWWPFYIGMKCGGDFMQVLDCWIAFPEIQYGDFVRAEKHNWKPPIKQLTK